MHTLSLMFANTQNTALWKLYTLTSCVLIFVPRGKPHWLNKLSYLLKFDFLEKTYTVIKEMV